MIMVMLYHITHLIDDDLIPTNAINTILIYRLSIISTVHDLQSRPDWQQTASPILIAPRIPEKSTTLKHNCTNTESINQSSISQRKSKTVI